MGEVKEKENEIVEALVARGYDLESARKCVEDVLTARKDAREKYLKNYLGKRIRAEFEGLLFEVIVKDVKMDHDGKAQFQVTPLNGSRCVWIKNFVLD